VGYILGPRVAAIMVGGGLLSWLVLIPALAWWGEGRVEPFYPETVRTIAEMAPRQMWTSYVRYIGAGAVAAAGLITLLRSVPTIVESFRVGAEQLRRRLNGGTAAADELRTDRDHSLVVVAVGVALVVLALAGLPFVFGVLQTLPVRLVAAVLAAMAAFFFVTVSSRIVGLVGVTSNPTSGMTIATLLVTSAVFLGFGWTDDLGKVAAITVGCVVAIAASMAGDISQDLKTGFLLGATPMRQQTGEIVGVLTSAVFVCLTVLLLDRAYGFGTTELPAPQATLMKVVIEGVLQQSLPWTLVGIGVAIAVVCELLRIPSLPFAVGIYLPVSTTFPVFVGGALRWLVERGAADEETAKARRERGVLTGSGFVGGEGIVGVAIAGTAVLTGRPPAGIGPEWAGDLRPWLATAGFVGLASLFALLARRSQASG
jgi:putative OPT family oligopeptide transporter